MEPLKYSAGRLFRLFFFAVCGIKLGNNVKEQYNDGCLRHHSYMQHFDHAEVNDFFFILPLKLTKVIKMES